MPSFLNWPVALGAASIVVPLLVLLYFLKLRRQEMPVSSTLLWRRAIQDLQVNAPFQRLRRNLLLLLQLLLLLFLLAAFARPVTNSKLAPGKISIILIDHSASMSATDLPDKKTRLSEAQRQACELVDALDKDASAMVIAFDDSADSLSSFTSDRAMLKQTINAIKPGDRRSRLKQAYQLAEAKAMAFYGDQLRPDSTPPDIFLYSDGRVADADELSLRSAMLHYVRIGTDTAPNRAIVALNAKRNYQKPAEVQIFVRVANFGPEPVDAVLQLSIDGAVPAGGVKPNLHLLPERWTEAQRDAASKAGQPPARDSAEFTVELTRSAVVKVELKEQSDDPLAADDAAQVVIPPPRWLNAMLVSKRGNLWLEKLLQSANLKNPVSITTAEYEKRAQDPQALSANYDLILFDDYVPATLPPVGNFIFFNQVPPDTKLIAVTNEQGQPQRVSGQLVMDWDREHPITRSLNLKFYAEDVLRIRPAAESQVLVEGRDAPLVVFHRQGRQAYLVVAFDVQKSNWPTSRWFPNFFDYAFEYMALGADMDVRQSYPPGATPTINRLNLVQAGGGKLEQLTLAGPPAFGTVTVSIPPAGDFALPPLDKVGLYTLTPPIPQFEKIAVNLLDANESNLIPAATAPGGTEQTAQTVATGQTRRDLWRYLILAAIPLCLLEWWVYTRRTHL